MTVVELEKEVIHSLGYNLTDLSEILLDALKANGVDNWDGYDESIQTYKTWLKELIDENNS